MSRSEEAILLLGRFREGRGERETPEFFQDLAFEVRIHLASCDLKHQPVGRLVRLDRNSCCRCVGRCRGGKGGGAFPVVTFPGCASAGCLVMSWRREHSRSRRSGGSGSIGVGIILFVTRTKTKRFSSDIATIDLHLGKDFLRSLGLAQINKDLQDLVDENSIDGPLLFSVEGCLV